MINNRHTKFISVLLVSLIFVSVFSFSVSAKDVWNCSKGDIFEFGSYPQTKVEDAQLLLKLNSCELNWISYDYYSGTGKWYDGKMESSDFMKYADVDFDGNKYRAVVFSQFRPYCTGLTSESSYQDDNGYKENTVYWFSYEPLRWRMLDASEGFAVCESIIDAQAYHNTLYYYSQDDTREYYQDDSCLVFANNYKESSIREWLNNDFSNTAFSENERKAIKATDCDNSSWNPNYTEFNGGNTQDKVFLLSYNDVLNASYGFDSDRTKVDIFRQAKTTDYAVCQGLNVHNSDDEYSGNAWWWLRSPGSYSGSSCGVNFDGNASHYYNTNYVLNGIRPALKLDIKALVPKTQVKAENIVVYYKNTNALETEIKEIEGVDYTAEYLSSDEKVAIVDENGNVTAKGRGTAEITCILTDEYGNVTEDTCTVEVKLFWWQWIIYIVLFGWIWY
ncbi:MAG: hypothetical protein E7536_01560 [Ruminococcaceae bacterium]|nr:hypothetical protein [Oscillospiraceae bacterium]